MLVSDGFPLASLKAVRCIERRRRQHEAGCAACRRGEGRRRQAYRADEKIDGGPSVLFDAVVLLVTEDGLKPLADNPATRDFVADAMAHIISLSVIPPAAKPLVEMAGGKPTEGQLVSFDGDASMGDFIKKCRQLRTFKQVGSCWADIFCHSFLSDRSIRFTIRSQR